MLEYDHDISYKIGKENNVLDAYQGLIQKSSPITWSYKFLLLNLLDN